MTSRQPARLLFIDDDDNLTPAGLQDFLPNLSVRLRSPEDVVDQDVEWADLVVLDFFLDSWPERDESALQSASRSPLTGLAVAAVLQSRSNLRDERPTAFAVWSGDLSRATGGLPPEVREHVFARQHGIEWIFPRQEPDRVPSRVRVESQLEQLASAIGMLPLEWPGRSEPSAAETELWKLLALDESQSWAETARSEARNCRPPLHELSARSHGLALIRWFLHRILPYPTFLIDENYVKTRLRADSLGPEILAELEPSRYEGALSSFLGDRWWRAGVEEWVFNLNEESEWSPTSFGAILREKGAVVRSPTSQPVVAISESYRASHIAELDECVRVQPDDWPVFAEDAWARVSDVLGSKLLSALVVAEDVEILDRSREESWG